MTLNINYQNASTYLDYNSYSIKYNNIFYRLKEDSNSYFVDILFNTTTCNLIANQNYYIVAYITKILTNRQTQLIQEGVSNSVLKYPYLVYDTSISIFNFNAVYAEYNNIRIANLGLQTNPNPNEDLSRYVAFDRFYIYDSNTFNSIAKIYNWNTNPNTDTELQDNVFILNYNGSGNATSNIISSDNYKIQDRTKILKIKTTDGTINRTITINQPFIGIGRMKVGTNFIIR